MLFLIFAIIVCVASAIPVVRLPTCPVVLPTHPTARVVGGGEASLHTRSFFVSFYEEGCGGSLLSNTWVLTAAHCLVNDGSMARISGANSSNGVEIPVKRVINHPNYKFPKDDITLVELQSPAPPSASFIAVNSNPSVPEDGEYARVAGYGFQGESFDHHHDAVLREVDVPVMNTEKCIKMYYSVHSYLREDISDEKHLCAGYDDGGCDSCTADSGGPLFVYDNGNSPVQIAIVSFGYGCARNVPGGYTRISTYVSWMRSVGAVFDEKTSRKAFLGGNVSGAGGIGPDEIEEEMEEEQTNENTFEPVSENPSVPSPEDVTDPGSAVQSNPAASETPTHTPVTPTSGGKPSESNTSPPASPPPSPPPSAHPSPPAHLPPNHAAGTPSVSALPSSTGPQDGHDGEGRPRPHIVEPEPSSEEGTIESASSSAGGSDSDSGSSGDDGADKGGDGDADNTPGDEETGQNSSGEPSENSESVSPSPHENNENVGTHTPIDPDGNDDADSTQGEGDGKDRNSGSNGTNTGDNSSNAFGPILIPDPSSEVLLASSPVDFEEREELEPSSSPEVIESPEDSNVGISGVADAEKGGLSGLQIAMIVVGISLVVMIGGYVAYFVVAKMAK